MWIKVYAMVSVVIALGYAGISHAQTSATGTQAPQFIIGDHSGSEDNMLELRRRRPVPAFNLVDQHGNPFTQEQMQGKWTILFFGYTHCPDYCPTTLAALRGALRRLQRENPKLGGSIQVVFISVDPFRDTPAVLADYVSYFSPQFIGATGATAELKRFTTLLGISYDYADGVTGSPVADTTHRPPGDYVVDHSADFYVFDDHARLLVWVEPPHTTHRVTSMLKSIMKHYGGW